MEKNKIQKPVIPNCDLLAENLEGEDNNEIAV